MTNRIGVFFSSILKGTHKVPFGLFCLFIFLGCSYPVFAQSGDDGPIADEITVTLEFRGIGTMDVPAMYNDKDVFLSLPHVFDFLRIRNVLSPSFDSVKGYFLNEGDTFLVENPGKRMFYRGKVIDLAADGIMKSETGIYMNLKYFKSVFGIDGIFYFRRLVVTLSTEFELPVMREMKQENMRKNLNRLKGDQSADTAIKVLRPGFHFGMADWAVMSSQQSQGADQTTVNLGLGAAIAGGEANASINYYSQQSFTEKQQFYQWRYVNNEFSAMRQVVAGKIFTQAISSLYAPVVGVQVTNAPTTYRSSYGTYRISNNTQPNWVVELYVNDILVDYAKADASGFYSFDVPLMYGITIVKLRFYGPYGEERTTQQFINIPFNFLPKHEFEYSASAGIVEDDQDSKFSRVRTSYGVTRSITVGGGVEYLSSVTSGTTMPFLNTSVRLTQRIMVSGDYTHNVRSRGILSYRLPGGLQMDLDYTKYKRGQTAIYYNYLEEKKVVLSLPIRTKKLSLFTRLTVDQVVVPETRYTNTEWSLMGFYKRFGINFSTYASFVRSDIPYIYSIATLTVPLPHKIIFTTQFQYDYKDAKPVFAKLTIEKNIFNKGYLDFSYANYFNVHTYNFLVGLRYDFSFARVALSALTGNNNTYSRVEAASGSLICDAKTHYLATTNRSNVGKSGIVVQPFLDLNGNNRRDAGEPKAPGLKIKINGGRVFYNDDDTLIRVLDLEPYYKYFVELNRNSFDNVSWQIRNPNISVIASPNNFTLINVPVSIAGEVSGTVSIKGRGAEKPRGQGQISICIYSHDSMLVARVLSESDGFFNYLGLTPGNYFVKLDSVQLHNMHYRVSPASIPVSIKPGIDGDVADGLDFVLQSLKDTATAVVRAEGNVNSEEQVVAKKDSVRIKKETGDGKVDTKHTTASTEPGVPAKTATEDEEVIGKKGSFAILVDVFDDITKAGVLKAKIVRMFKVPVAIVQQGEDYKVEMVGFTSRDAARKHLPRLKEWGFPEALIIRLKEQVVK